MITVESSWDAEAVLKIRAAELKAVSDVAEQVLTVSDARVPFRTGKLELSGRVVRDLTGPAAAAVGYSEFYAIWQHENLTYHHPNGRHAKFLETALADVAPQGAERMAEIVRTELGGA